MSEQNENGDKRAAPFAPASVTTVDDDASVPPRAVPPASPEVAAARARRDRPAEPARPAGHGPVRRAALLVSRFKDWLLGPRGSRLKRLFTFVTYVYISRFSLLTLAALVGIWYAAFFTRLRPLLHGLFDVRTLPGVFFISLAAFMTAWMAMAMWRLVRLYGQERFKVESFGVELSKAPRHMGFRHMVPFGLCAVPLVAGVVYGGAGRPLRSVFAFGALFISLALIHLAAILQHLFTVRLDERRHRDQDVPDLLVPTHSWPYTLLVKDGERDWGEHGRARRRLTERVARWVIRRLGGISEFWGCGIFEYDDAARDGERAGGGRRGHGGRVRGFKSGHGVAANLFLLGLLVYFMVGLPNFVGQDFPATYPSLVYVLLLLMLLCWVLSMAAFILDRFRIPVTVLVVVWLFGTSQFATADHFYHVRERAAAATPPAAPARPRGPIIAVAVNGGGIQASAWAARVLTGLELAARREFGPEFRDFGRAVRVVSSVSGGSVGAMYFVNEYTPKGELPDDVELKKVAARAQASSLDPVAWGLAYPDFLRLLLPVNFRADRGLALEEAWMRKDEEGWGARAGLRRGLAEWRADAEAGLRPASIFNTTITDTGERLTLASCDLSAASARSALLRGPGGARPQGRKNFEDVFGEVGGGRYDLAVVTAARLSATFPYVSPAARADLGGAQAAQSHVVDGGYYDNYGVSSLVEWLDDELTKRREAAQGAGLGRAGGEAAAERVLIILVEGAPPDPNEHKSPRGWFYQAFAPLSTLLHVRDTGQRSHNTVELELLKEKWEMLGVAVTSVVFDFDGDNSPLSWHLTDEEKCRIESKWGDELKGKWAPVRDFLVGGGAVSLDAGAAYRADPPAGCPARP